jgi:hypothetical protein
MSRGYIGLIGTQIIPSWQSMAWDNVEGYIGLIGTQIIPSWQFMVPIKPMYRSKLSHAMNCQEGIIWVPIKPMYPSILSQNNPLLTIHGMGQCRGIHWFNRNSNNPLLTIHGMGQCRGIHWFNRNSNNPLLSIHGMCHELSRGDYLSSY